MQWKLEAKLQTFSGTVWLGRGHRLFATSPGKILASRQLAAA